MYFPVTIVTSQIIPKGWLKIIIITYVINGSGIDWNRPESSCSGSFHSHR